MTTPIVVDHYCPEWQMRPPTSAERWRWFLAGAKRDERPKPVRERVFWRINGQLIVSPGTFSALKKSIETSATPGTTEDERQPNYHREGVT